MSKVSVPRTGLALGILAGGFHAVWAGLVAAGWGQPLLDLIFRLHFIDPPYHVTAFNLPTAATLVGLTFAIGMVCGLALAMTWNSIGSSATPRAE